jgi:hypothetical protein
MFFPDEQSFQRLDFKRRPADEEAADTKALELLKNSPYKEEDGKRRIVPESAAAAVSGITQPDPSSSRK